MTTTALYASLPLSPEKKQIRVLDIVRMPAPSDADTTGVVGSLRIIDLDVPKGHAPPVYFALSYTWGEWSSPADTITINITSLGNTSAQPNHNQSRNTKLTKSEQVYLPITKNCLSALRHLRKILPSSSSTPCTTTSTTTHDDVITLWIDAICINQADEAEKLHQIALMSHVYSSALTVYAWLGEGTKSTDAAMDYLAQGGLPFASRISSHSSPSLQPNTTPIPFNGPHDIELGAQPEPQTQSHSQPPIPTGLSLILHLALHLLLRILTGRATIPHFSALDAIFSSPWITRLWTLQEAVLARHLVLVCGNKHLEGTSLVYFLCYADFLRSKVLTLGLPPSIAPWRTLVEIWQTKQRKIRTTSRNSDEADGTARSPREGGGGRAAGGMVQHSVVGERDLATHRQHMESAWYYYRIIMGIYFIVSGAALIGLFIYMVKLALTQTKSGKSSLTGHWELFVELPIWVYWAYMTIRLFQHLRTEVYRIHPQTPAESLLMDLVQRRSYDPKDRYFAVLSLLNDEKWNGGKGNDVKSGTGLDYTTTSIQANYERLFVETLGYTGSLNVLLYAGGRRDFPAAQTDQTPSRTPSWVVDWRTTTSLWALGRFYRGRFSKWERKMTLGRLEYLSDIWNNQSFEKSQPWGRFIRAYPGATLQSECEWSFDGKGSLSVRGAVVGVVEYSSGPLAAITKQSTDEEIAASLDAVFGALRDLGDRAKTPDVAHLFRLADLPMNQGWNLLLVLNKEIAQAGGAAVASILRWPWPLWWSPYTGGTAWKGHQNLTAVYSRGHVAFARYRGSIGLDTGKCFMGAVPDHTCHGDVVALIAGVSLPMILRPNQTGAYEIVGPAMFGRIMWGEVWQSLDRSRLQILQMV